MIETATVSTLDEARAVLGVSHDATAEQVRAAYLEKVRQHPPDRDPEQFERIRDAFGQLRDPRSRLQQVFECPDPHAPWHACSEIRRRPAVLPGRRLGWRC